VWWCALAVLCLALLAPLTLADVPPLLDYPNHLARLFVLAFVANDPVLARFYEPHWGIIPNLALDLTVPPLLRILPVHFVGRAVVGVTLLLPVFGAVAYHRALSGRLSYWPLTSVLFVYNAASLRGFLNFIASVGLALLVAAAWLEWRERRPTLAILIAIAGAAGLFFCHLIGLLFFAILIGGHELANLRSGPFRARITSRRIAIVIAVFILPVLLYAASNLQGMNGDSTFRSAEGKAHAALIPVINYLWPLDIATGLLCVAVPVFCLAKRWCVVPFQAAAAIGVLIILFVGLPTAFKGTYDLDSRFIVMASALAPAVLVPAAQPRRAAWIMCAGFLFVFTVRMGILMAVWHAWAAELVQFRAVIAPVQPGDVVLTVRLPRGNEPSIWTSTATARRLSDGTVVDGHIAALLLIEHRAWWPFLFDNPSQQPIETREPFRTLADRIDNSRDPLGLLASATPETRIVTHVLIRGPAPGPDQIAREGLQRLTGNGEAALFAVTHAKPVKD
jgi:hypothetical protein